MDNGGIIIRDKKNIELLKIKNIEKKEAIEDYKKFDDLKCGEINPNSNIGNKFLDYFFFEQRIKTKSRKGINYFEFIEKKKNNKITEKHKMTLTKFFKWNKENSTRSKEQILYDFFRLYYGSINQFKPCTAKFIYCKYKPTSILDISAGWGGRLLGAISLDIKYTGFDTNINLIEPYKDIFKIVGDSKQKIIYKDSSTIDFSKYEYDMVFTSPPYYTLELYENMPEYKDKKDWNDKFLFPVVKNSFKNLKKNGHFILNVPKYIYEDLREILGDAHEKIGLKITKRSKTTSYEEFMYIWKK